jgi:ATP-dependent DNA helicase DinG
VNNDGTELFVVVEVPRRKSVTRLDRFAVLEMLGSRGPIAARMGGFEDRQGRRDMVAHMADAYNDGGVVPLEAGTGIGKSFAYLVPPLAWAKANGERTVVSTNTINLQEQLVGKDLPLLREALADARHAPTFALLKGWRNYLCLARLRRAARPLRVAEPHPRRHLRRSAGGAEPRGVGRGRGGGSRRSFAAWRRSRPGSRYPCRNASIGSIRAARRAGT